MLRWIVGTVAAVDLVSLVGWSESVGVGWLAIALAASAFLFGFDIGQSTPRNRGGSG